jgi:hypothetical protein
VSNDQDFEFGRVAKSDLELGVEAPFFRSQESEEPFFLQLLDLLSQLRSVCCMLLKGRFEAPVVVFLEDPSQGPGDKSKVLPLEVVDGGARAAVHDAAVGEYVEALLLHIGVLGSLFRM